MICSTVIQECELIVREDSAFARKVATALLDKLVSKWNILPKTPDDSVTHGCSEQFARDLQAATDPEFKLGENTFLSVTDSALAECELLLTWRPEHLKIRRQEHFNLTLLHLDLMNVEVVTPVEICASLGRTK